MQEKIRDRDPADTNTFSGKCMASIVDEWTQKLQGCYVCLQEQKWQCPGTAKATAATKQAEKAEKKAEKAEQTAVATTAKAAATQTAYKETEEHLRQMLAQFQQMVVQADAAQAQAQDDAVETAKKAQAAALRHLWDVTGRQRQAACAAHEAALEVAQWKQAAIAAWLPWMPTPVPFLISWDNCPSYSLYEDSKQEKLLPIVPIIQVPPHVLNVLASCDAVHVTNC